MFVALRGLGATMARALCQLALDRNADAYEEIRPPTMVRTDTLVATGQLPKFADDAYHVERDDLWAIPTAEVPLTSLYRDEILDEAELPKRLMAYSPCYRREAGAAGKDTRGLLRVHEFDKVEILALTTPDQAAAMHDEILQRAIGTLVGARAALPRARDLHRRPRPEPRPPVRRRGVRAGRRPVARGELGVVVHRLPGAPRQHPLPPPKAASRTFVHTLNGSALAVPRVLAALLEQNRNADGTVTIPEGVASVLPRRRGHRLAELAHSFTSRSPKRGGTFGLAS